MEKSMTRQDRLKIMRQFVDQYCFPTLEAKGRDYDDGEGGNDIDMATLPQRGVDRYVVLWVQFMKQVAALRSWIVTRKLVSELLESRIKDIINYCLILVSMLVEDGIVKLEHNDKEENDGSDV